MWYYLFRLVSVYKARQIVALAFKILIPKLVTGLRAA